MDYRNGTLVSESMDKKWWNEKLIISFLLSFKNLVRLSFVSNFVVFLFISRFLMGKLKVAKWKWVTSDRRVWDFFRVFIKLKMKL